MRERAGVFDAAVEFDLNGFAPKQAKPGKGDAAEEAIRAVSEASSFRSREPVNVKKEHSAKREPRRHRTGRNIQLNLKVRAEVFDEFYEIADGQGWVLGETLERAVAALQRELVATKTKRT